MRLGVLVGVLSAIGLPFSLMAQGPSTHPAPLYSLPPDGTWVQFEWKGLGPDRKEQLGTLRISSVGVGKLGEAEARWIELRHEMGKKPEVTGVLRKLLVPVASLGEGGPLATSVREGYSQPIPPNEVTRLLPAEIADLLSLGLQRPTGRLTVLDARVELDTKLGKLATRRVAASGKASESTTLEYTGWLTDAVPFGWARFEMREKTGDNPPRLLYTATVVTTGKDAKSELDEKKAK